jgi:uncharacterized paraquat-inducible protein A
MPLSRCPKCGFTCRVLLQGAKAPHCPDCEAQMTYIGRAALADGQRPTVAGSLRFMRDAGRRRTSAP